MPTLRNNLRRRLEQAQLAVRVFLFNTLPSGAQAARKSRELDRQLDRADRENVRVESDEAHRQEQRFRHWLEEAATLDGNTDPLGEADARTNHVEKP